MNRDIFTMAELTKDAQQAVEALNHITSSCQSIKAVGERLNQIAASWNAKRAGGAVSADDVAALEARTRGLSALLAAVDAYLQGQ